MQKSYSKEIKTNIEKIIKKIYPTLSSRASSSSRAILSASLLVSCLFWDEALSDNPRLAAKETNRIRKCNASCHYSVIKYIKNGITGRGGSRSI